MLGPPELQMESHLSRVEDPYLPLLSTLQGWAPGHGSHDFHGFQTRDCSDMTGLKSGQRSMPCMCQSMCIHLLIHVFFHLSPGFLYSQCYIIVHLLFCLICETWKIIKILLLLCEVILVLKWNGQESVHEWTCTIPKRIVGFWRVFFAVLLPYLRLLS